jgi:trimeric autotransporter adhesin
LASLNAATTSPGQGFFFYFRGDNINNWGGAANPGTGLKLNAPYVAPEDVTVTYTGNINKGNISPAISYTNNNDINDGYNLIGNPYPSTIDWSSSAITKTNLTDKLLILKPGGGLAQYSDGISTNQPNGSGAVNIIQPGQAFYVIANGTNPSITFTEACKVPDSAPVRLLSMPADEVTAINSSSSAHSVSSTSLKVMRLNLQDNTNTEEIAIAFQDGRTANYDVKDDALFFGGTTISLSSASADGKNLSINFMPDVSEVSAVKLNANAAASGSFKLNFTDLSGAGSMDVILKDVYLNTETDVKANPVYNFSMDKTKASSFGANRFTLLFKPPVVVPEEPSSFTADTQLSVYPNPASTEMEISLNNPVSGKILLNIFDLTGNKIQSITFESGAQLKATIAGLSSGMYLAEVRDLTKNETIGTTRFIKN